jgi:hypothetical protein
MAKLLFRLATICLPAKLENAALARSGRSSPERQHRNTKHGRIERSDPESIFIPAREYLRSIVGIAVRKRGPGLGEKRLSGNTDGKEMNRWEDPW